MTNPENQGISMHGNEQLSFDDLRQKVLSWYDEESPEFAYKMHDNRIGMLTIDDFLAICGEEIIKVPLENLKPLFDKYHNIAKVIHEKGDQFVDLTRKVGGEVLARYEQDANE